jgi:hypothetical protein
LGNKVRKRKPFEPTEHQGAEEGRKTSTEGGKERRGEGVGCGRAGDSAASEKSEERRQMKMMTGVRGRTSEKRRFDRPRAAVEVC